MYCGLIFLAILGSVWSMPQEIDDLLVVLGTADSDVDKYFVAMETSDFDAVPLLTKKMKADLPNLKIALDKVQNIDPGKGLKSFKRLLVIQASITIDKIDRALPSNRSGH